MYIEREREREILTKEGLCYECARLTVDQSGSIGCPWPAFSLHIFEMNINPCRATEVALLRLYHSSHPSTGSLCWAAVRPRRAF